MTVQNERQEGDGLFGVAARATGTAAQMGLTVASMPLVLLPAGARRHVRKAMGELALGAVALPRGVANAVEHLVDDIWENADAPTPSELNLSERARSFAKRVASAAEDVTAAVGSITRRAGDAIERSAEQLDDWAQGRQPAPKPVGQAAKTVDDWVEKKAE